MKAPTKYREAIYAEAVRATPDAPLLPVSPAMFIGWHYWGWIDGEWVSPESGTPEDSYLFTGFFTEDGTEAYEGDIVTAGDNYPSVIEWDTENGKFFLHELYPRRGRYADRCDRGHELTCYTTGLGKVIGNIVETSQILRKLWRHDGI